MVEFHLFLMALSVLPGRSFEISAHLFPCFLCASIRVLSSSMLQGSCLMSGFRWLCHLSLHCLPILPGSFSAITLHFFGPCSLTREMIFLSSSGVHGPLMRSGFSTFCHRWRHWTSLLSVKYSAIFFQFFPSHCCTALLKISSSSFVQPPLLDFLFGAPVFPSTGGRLRAASVNFSFFATSTFVVAALACCCWAGTLDGDSFFGSSGCPEATGWFCGSNCARGGRAACVSAAACEPSGMDSMLYLYLPGAAAAAGGRRASSSRPTSKKK
mmetsp:Transcript_4754/g.14192  ORF Transcript_4754/g.14192 Transcript_4754/m.14192 type:complete len:269 (-) Transcript_4754:195-1001(-)